MGLLSAIQGIGISLGTMKDIVTTGIASAKLVSQMEKLAETAQNEYKSQFAPADSAFSLKYRKAKEKYEKAQETGASDEERNRLSEESEDKLAVFVKSLSRNEKLPLEFRANCEKTAKEYTETKDAAINAMEARFMKMAKTDEEKESVQKIMNEARKDYK